MLLMMGLAIAPALVSCEDDDATDTSADAVVRYFRPTDMRVSDSLITELSLGQTVAMIGENLDNVIAMRFNDKDITLNPTYITSESIVFTTPMAIPGEVTNKLYITQKNGNIQEIDVPTILPAPTISNVNKGYLKEGDKISIKGNYFIPTQEKAVEIELPGGVTVTPDESSSYTVLNFAVPSGISANGALKIKTAFGSTTYPYEMVTFDNLSESKVDGILFDFDGKNGALANCNGWRNGYLADAPVALTGKSYRFGKDGFTVAGANWYEDNMCFNYWPDESDNINTRVAVGDLKQYAYQMEVYIGSPWKTMPFNVIPTSLAAVSASNNNNQYYYNTTCYQWTPYNVEPDYTTGGEWITLTMPLSEFNKTADGKAAAGPLSKEDLAGLTLLWSINDGSTWPDQEFTPDMYVDNIRIVKAKY